jgi:hypothetical protein
LSRRVVERFRSRKWTGRYAFGVGGGFEGKPPTVNARETGIEQLDLGVITRF